MIGPGAYRPDPTEGITAIADLPAPEIVPYSRTDKRQPCPRCGHSAYRDKQFQRTLHDLGNLDLWCPRDLVVTYAQHYWLSDSIGDHVILTMISNTIGKPGTGKRQDGLNGVKERPVPVVFEDAPAALDRIVLTMVWRVIGQSHTYGI